MPCSGLKGPGALRFSPATPRALLSPFSSPSRPPLRFPVSNPARGKLPAPKTSTSKAEVSDKKLPLPTTRRLQPAADFYFLPLNTYSPALKIPFLYSPFLSLPFITFGDVIFVFIFSAGPTLICRNGSSLSSSTRGLETSHFQAGLAARSARGKIFSPSLQLKRRRKLPLRSTGK